MEETLEKRGHEVDTLYQLSQLVSAGLDRRVLAVVIELIEAGINPESIADGKRMILSFPFTLDEKCHEH